MDYFTVLFWIGVFILLSLFITVFPASATYSIIGLIGLTCMFVGSKIGRKFLGIE